MKDVMFLELKILNNQTIKITLKAKDMEKYNITYDILNNNKKITKNIILNILENVKNNITLNLNKKNFFLETFKTKEKGCILYLSVPNKSLEKTNLKTTKNNSTVPTIATFKKMSNMKNFCINISDIFKKQKFESELYSFEDKFVLAVFVPEIEKEKFLAIIKEFGKIYGKGKIKYGTIKEHCKPIFKQNAVENILKK